MRFKDVESTLKTLVKTLCKKAASFHGASSLGPQATIWNICEATSSSAWISYPASEAYQGYMVDLGLDFV